MKYIAAFAASVLLACLLGKLIGLFALFVGIVVFLVACTLMLKPSPRPAPDDVPLGGAIVASVLLGAASTPVRRRFGQTQAQAEREAAERQRKAIGNVVGTTVDLAVTGAELGADYVGNVVDVLTGD
jgi:hypothetical protein